MYQSHLHNNPQSWFFWHHASLQLCKNSRRHCVARMRFFSWFCEKKCIGNVSPLLSFFKRWGAVLRSVFFWEIMQRGVVILYRHFGTTYLSHLDGPRSPRRNPVIQLTGLRTWLLQSVSKLRRKPLIDSTLTACYKLYNPLKTKRICFI
jgi:hypothetical protein